MTHTPTTRPDAEAKDLECQKSKKETPTEEDDDVEIASAPELRRAQELSPRPLPQPGAVRVSGLPLPTSEENESRLESNHFLESYGDQPPLVQAELVVPPDEEPSPLPVETSSEAFLAHIPAEIFHATPMKTTDSESTPTPRLKELINNGTVRIVIFLVFLLIVGLVIGMVVGINSSSRSIVIEVDDVDELEGLKPSGIPFSISYEDDD